MIMKFKSEEECVQHLTKMYTKLRHPLFMSSAITIYDYYKGKLSIKKIEDFLSGIDSYTLHRLNKKPKRNFSYVYFWRERMEFDLIEISKVSHFNNGFRYILVGIDIFSRYAFARLLKTKRAEEVLQKYDEIMKECKTRPKRVIVDLGKEFKNNLFKRYNSKNDIELVFCYTSKPAYCERFNRTIQSLIYKYCTQYQTFKFHDKLQDFIFTYNSKKNRITELSPTMAERASNHDLVRAKLEKNKYSMFKRRKPKYKIGQTVRISFIKGRFARSYQVQNKEELFKITGIKNKLPVPLYKIKDLLDNPIEGYFMESELIPTKQQYFRIEKVLKKTKTKLFVKWQGYNNSHNSWINLKDVVNYSEP